MQSAAPQTNPTQKTHNNQFHNTITAPTTTNSSFQILLQCLMAMDWTKKYTIMRRAVDRQLKHPRSAPRPPPGRGSPPDAPVPPWPSS